MLLIHIISKSRRFLKGYAPAIRRVQDESFADAHREAVEQAITECIKEGILAEFLKKNRAEAFEMSIFEYNEELHLANLRREGYEEGLEYGITQGITQGKAMSILELLDELGEVSEELKDRILGENQTEVLSKWHKLAAKADSMKAFEELIEE